MLPGTSLRKRLCGWLAALMLLVQWMTSAYACLPPAPQPAAPAMEAPCHAGPEHAQADQPALCKAHCEAGMKAPGLASSSDAPEPGPGWFIVQADPAAALFAPLPPAARPALARTGAPPGWPPLHLTLQVLRN